jgi:hypothetical protein
MGKPIPVFKRWLPLLMLAIAVVSAAPARAELLQARIGKLRTSAGSMQSVQLRLDWPRDAARGQMHLRAAQVELPALSWSARDLDWQCPLLRTPQGRWRCDGPVRVKGGGAQRLVLEFSADALGAELVAGRSSISFGREIAAGSVDARRVRLQRVPVAWLKAFLAGMWQEGRWTAGTMDGWVDVAAPERGPLHVRTDLALAGLGVETPDGSLAASGLSGRLQLDYRSVGGADSADVDFLASGGELLFQRFYAKLPASKVRVQVLAQRKGKQPWRLPRLRWNDPGALEVEGEGVLDADAAPSDMQLRLAIPNLALARDRYLSGFLAPAGFPDLVLSGSVGATLRMAGGDPVELDARLSDVNAVDTKARFTLAGMAGDLRWNAGAGEQASELHWDSGALYGIGLGPARFAFASSKRELRLARAAEIEALQGKVAPGNAALAGAAGRARRALPVRPGRGQARPRQPFAAAGLAGLHRHHQRTPAFGALRGRSPRHRWRPADGCVRRQRGADRAGDGAALRQRAHAHRQRRDRGRRPRADHEGDRLRHHHRPPRRPHPRPAPGQLESRSPSTRDWRPTARGRARKRLSQRAVKDISDVGGSGIAGGLQAKALAFFDDFGYERIGLACKLRDNVCTMDGVGSAGDGYIIVAGAGLPRIQVVGFRRQVDWPTLVARLEAATQGQSPVIK